MTPCRPCEKEQLKASLNLLSDYVGDKYPVGIEIVGPWNDYFDPRIIEQTKKNLQGLPKSVFLSLHAPFKGKIGSKRNFFNSEEGFLNLVRVVKLADELGVSLVNLHSSLLLSYKDLKKLRKAGDENVKIYKTRSIMKVKRALEDIQFIAGNSDNRKLCLENVPYVWSGDSILDPKRAIHEITFVEPDDFFRIVNPTANIFATIDVCHLTYVYDSSQLLGEIKKLGRSLGHIHLSDLGEIWQPFTSLAKEGVIPGDGRIGEKVFKELLGYFLEYSRNQDLSINMEINDKNFVKLEESKESFKRIMKWIGELDS